MCLNRCCIEKACKSVCADADHLASQQQASKRAQQGAASKASGQAEQPAQQASTVSTARTGSFCL